jgi:hypothetical protein
MCTGDNNNSMPLLVTVKDDKIVVTMPGTSSR